MMTRVASRACILFLLLGAGLPVPALADVEALARARRLYNQGLYESAIAAAREAQATPAEAQSAALIIARARLGRFRQTGDPEDLALARMELQQLDPTRLGARERTELIVGLGEALFLGRSYGVAAELFRTALLRSQGIESTDRDEILDWWATARDREAQELRGEERGNRYREIVAMMEEELVRQPSSATAVYWICAATHASGDVERAWQATAAAWIRAPLTSNRPATLRAELDRLMTAAILPDRARLKAAISVESEDLLPAMLAEWELLKEQWGLSPWPRSS